MTDGATEEAARAPTSDPVSSDVNDNMVCEESCEEGGDGDMEVVTVAESEDHGQLERANNACSDDEGSDGQSALNTSLREIIDQLEQKDHSLNEQI